MRIKLALVATAAMLALVATTAMAGNSTMYRHGPALGVGTCPNPLAPDDDGDGIPNGLDPDYVPPRDGSGRGACVSDATSFGHWGWLNFLPLRYGLSLPGGFGPGAGGPGAGNGYGPGDGDGNGGVGPRDGTGYGPGDGSGDCDGTGPSGFLRRRGR
jgi:hypothetical protein